MKLTRSSYETGILIKKYTNSIAKEIFRKSIHLCSSFVPLLLFYSYWTTLSLLFLALFGYFISEYFRVKGIKVPLVSKITEIAARKRDEDKIVLGPITLVLGIITCSLLWDFVPSTIGIFALAFGDGLASLVGKLFGKIHIPFTNGKTVGGSLACFFAVFVSSYCVCKNLVFSLIISVIATLIEMLPLEDLDNIVIPVIIGGISQMLLI